MSEFIHSFWELIQHLYTLNSAEMVTPIPMLILKYGPLRLLSQEFNFFTGFATSALFLHQRLMASNCLADIYGCARSMRLKLSLCIAFICLILGCRPTEHVLGRPIRFGAEWWAKYMLLFSIRPNSRGPADYGKRSCDTCILFYELILQ